MEIKIDPKEIQAAIVAEITKTAFGESIVAAVNKAMTEKTGAYGVSGDTIIEKAAKEQVLKVVAKAVDAELEKRTEDIKVTVRESITDDVVKEMTSNIIGVMTGRLKVDY